MNRKPGYVITLPTLGVALMLSADAQAVDAIQVGDLVSDPATICCLGYSVPVASGDDDYDAVASIEYRVTGSADWKSGLPLLRVRPEYISGETPPSQYGLPTPAEQFAGSLFALAPDTEYDVRISVTDPDGGSRTQTVTSRTRALPRTNPLVARPVNVATFAQLQSAVAGAQAGDLILMASGTYAGAITIDNSGTADNPIILRGEDAASVTVNASGNTYGVTIRGSYVYLEDVTVTGSTWGARTYDTQGVVIRRNRFVGVNRGIYAKSGTNIGYYICDNVLQGAFDWPNVSSSTWDEEGIAVSGQGHTICHNTLSGFGDAFSLAHETDIANIAIDVYGNDILWTGDDGIELDFAYRNVRAFGNRVSNAGMGVSMQPVWGGPVYVFRNQFLNLAHSPYKLNNDPSGFFIYHNTSARTLGTGNYGAFAWPQLGYTQSDGDPAYAANFEFKNNILIGGSAPAQVTTELFLADIDYNGWAPDGNFRFWDTWVNFADLRSNSPYEANGRLVDTNTFATPLTLPADYTTPWSGIDVELAADSSAIDAGLVLPNINDGYSGTGPDLGALEKGNAAPVYGARSANDTIAPAPPTNLRVE